MAKTHPHLDFPTPDELAALVVDKPDNISATYLALHQAVLDGAPHIVYSVDEIDGAIGYGAHQYGYNGWGMAAVTPFNKWVTLTLFAGPRISDPDELLSGTSQNMRHAKLTQPEQVAEHHDAIVALVIEATVVNAG